MPTRRKRNVRSAVNFILRGFSQRSVPEFLQAVGSQQVQAGAVREHLHEPANSNEAGCFYSILYLNTHR